MQRIPRTNRFAIDEWSSSADPIILPVEGGLLTGLAIAPDSEAGDVMVTLREGEKWYLTPRTPLFFPVHTKQLRFDYPERLGSHATEKPRLELVYFTECPVYPLAVPAARAPLTRIVERANSSTAIDFYIHTRFRRLVQVVIDVDFDGSTDSFTYQIDGYTPRGGPDTLYGGIVDAPAAGPTPVVASTSVANTAGDTQSIQKNIQSPHDLIRVQVGATTNNTESVRVTAIAFDEPQ